LTNTTPKAEPNTRADKPSKAICLHYAFVLGRGRSGTTWIGQILNQYYGCLYKYEPFNLGKSAAYEAWLRDLASGEPQELRARFEALCRACDHQVDYPPFISKPCRPQHPWLLRATWQLGKLAPACRGLYEWYGRPKFRSEDWVLIKQVNFPNERLDRLAEVLHPHVIAILRNPFASVSSALRFYRNAPPGRFRSAADVDRLLELLPTLTEFGIPNLSRSELESLSDAAFEALRWRVQTEPLAAFAARSPRALAMTHEQFAEEPEVSAKTAFAFLGWPFDDRVVNFIRETTQGERHRPGASERKKQHGIRRDPKQAVQRWKKDLSDEQIEEIRSIVRGSPLLARRADDWGLAEVL